MSTVSEAFGRVTNLTRNTRTLGQVCLAAVFLSAASVSGAAAQTGPQIIMGTPETGPAFSDVTDIRSLARAQGEIRVIIGISAPFELEGALSDASIATQRAGIAAGQASVLSALAQPAHVSRFQTIPYMALTVTPADLERLLERSDITSIALDIPEPPLLSESVRIVDAPPLWRAGDDGTGYSVVVLDTGARPNHAAFTGKIVASACFSSGGAGDASTLCPNGAAEQISRNGSRAGRDCIGIAGCGHGTHVAGIAVGEMRRNAGMARGANLIPMQVFTNFGSQVLSYSSDQIKALELASQWRNRFNIVAVNMSLGGGQYFGPCNTVNPARTAAIENLRSAGVATTIASGNNGYTGSVNAPACISAAINVGNTEKDDSLRVSSNHATMVNVLAPGTNILAADVSGARNALTVKTGTSMAAPHVAGAFAMLKSHNPSAKVDEIERALVCTGTPVARGGIAKPRISMTAARAYLNNPDTSNTWRFRSQAEVDEWSQGSGTWVRSGNALRVENVPGRYFYNATAPFCGDNMRATARISKETPVIARVGGILLSTSMNASGDFTGLLFGYGPSPVASGSLVAGIWEINAAVAGTNAFSAVNLCGNNSFLNGIDPAAAFDLLVTKQANTLDFAINGVAVCSATTSTRFANGHVGVFMETDNATPGFSMTVHQFGARALGGPRGWQTWNAGGGASLSGFTAPPALTGNGLSLIAAQ